MESVTNQLDALRDLLRELEADRSLSAPGRFRERSAALDRLDAYPLQNGQVLPPSESIEAQLYARAHELRESLEATNCELFEGIRAQIRHGAGAEALLSWAGIAPGNGVMTHSGSYDHLDELVSGVLRPAPPGEPGLLLTPEMVAYQPTPARHIFAMIRQAQLTPADLLIDLGSGLGHVPMLASICSGARSVGIELEPAYVRCARHSAADLQLDKVNFVQQDAREADLSSGTVFYLYTPFRGALLREVLESLRREAGRREIRICTFGPCTPAVAAEPWLQPVGNGKEASITMFRARRSAI